MNLPIQKKLALLLTISAFAPSFSPNTAIVRTNDDISWRNVFDILPAKKQISPSGVGMYNFYIGQWWRKDRLNIDQFEDTSNGLKIPLGGEIATASNKSDPGNLPLIRPSKSFRVEFNVKISSNNPDSWPALWLMPIEHDAKQSDHYNGRPVGFEQWVEIDVDEGGFGAGTHGVMINWEGKWPSYQRARMYGPKTSRTFLDRTKFHNFGFEYNARKNIARWIIDGKYSSEFDVDIMPNHRYYIIITAESHGEMVPYNLFVKRIRLYEGN